MSQSISQSVRQFQPVVESVSESISQSVSYQSGLLLVYIDRQTVRHTEIYGIILYRLSFSLYSFSLSFPTFCFVCMSVCVVAPPRTTAVFAQLHDRAEQHRRVLGRRDLLRGAGPHCAARGGAGAELRREQTAARRRASDGGDPLHTCRVCICR